MARRIEVVIDGDSAPLEQAFDRSSRAAARFNVGLEDSTRRAAAIGAGFFALGRGLEGAGGAMAAFQGHTSSTSNALTDAGNAIQSIITLDPAGFFQAVGARAERTREGLEKYAGSLKDVNQSTTALQVAQAASALGFDEQATAIRDQVEALQAAQAATDALEFSQRTYNQTVIDGVTYLVAFKGAHDAAMGGGTPIYGAGGGTTRPGMRTLPPMSPSQRRELELLAQTGTGRLPGLQDRAAQLRGQLAGFGGNQAQRLQLATRLKTTEAEIASILAAQATAQQAANRAAAERARLAREARLAAEQARQFRLIGLSPEGGAPIPTIANLRRQLEQLRGRLAGGESVPQKLLDRMGGVARALRQDITPDTREAIAEYFRAVRDELNKGDSDVAPVALRGLNRNRILRGLGLSGDQLRALGNRLSGFNVRGQALAGAGGGAFGIAGKPVEVHSYVNLDGQVVARSTKRVGDRHSIHSPKQRRGPNAGRS